MRKSAEQPVPTIEPGDWVSCVAHDPAEVQTVVRVGRHGLRIYLWERAGYLTRRDIKEVRSSDGSWWRRAEP